MEQAIELLRDPATPAVLALAAPALCTIALIKLWSLIKQSDNRLEALDAGQIELLAMMDRERRILAKFVATLGQAPEDRVQFKPQRNTQRLAPAPTLTPKETIVQPLRKTVH